MVAKEVVAYVQRLRSQGYNEATIRKNLIASGYGAFEAEQALSAVSRPGLRPKRNWIPILAGAGAGLGIVILLVVLLIPSGPAFILKTRPLNVEVRAGGDISFFNNIQYERDVDEGIDLVHELVAPTGNLLVTITEQISAVSQAQSSFAVPDDVQPGRYVIRTTATAGKTESTSSFSFKVLPKIQPVQPTTQLDLDGTEPDVTQQPQIECNDFDPCTEDNMVDGNCVFNQLPVCCGDYVCDFDMGETTATCSRDCAAQPAAKTSADIIQEAEEKAESDPGTAEVLCGTLALSSDADQCYNSVARIASRSSTCREISDSRIKDSCLLFFAINKDEFNVCTDINDPNLQSSCYSFKNLYEIQQTLPPQA